MLSSVVGMPVGTSCVRKTCQLARNCKRIGVISANVSCVGACSAQAVKWSLNCRVVCRAAQEQVENSAPDQQGLIGEDAAAFSLSKQKLTSWALFSAILAVVLGLLYAIWIRPGGFGEEYLKTVEGLSNDNPEITVVLLLGIFAVYHSGLAGLRAEGEKLIGERAYRVLFAAGSLCLAVVPIVFFINHRYDGTALWDIRSVPGVHELVWVLNFISFYFLYPSTFNLLEVAAVDKPKVHLWETGIMRITRHPQATGQGLWCLAHTLWIGNSFMVVTSLALLAHHAFGCWHGDRRLRSKYGQAFEEVKGRTSITPFQAIWEGRQQLPKDYYKEFLRAPYITITLFTLGAYLAHPLMQLASYQLKW